MNELLEKIPGLQKAIEHEEFVRDQAFLDLPEVICGIDVQPLTLRQALLLESIGSPFLVGGTLQPHDVGAFFIVVCGMPEGWARWRLLRRVGNMNPKEAGAAIESYLAETFMDKPPTSGGATFSYYSNAAFLIDFFASQYGWSEKAILNAKLKRLFQFFKAATKRINPKIPLFNPSGKMISAWLTEQNTRRN